MPFSCGVPACYLPPGSPPPEAGFLEETLTQADLVSWVTQVSRFHFSLSSDHLFLKEIQVEEQAQQGQCPCSEDLFQGRKVKGGVLCGPCLFLCVWGLPEMSTAQYANQRWRSELPGVTPDAR